ncbi:defensin [Striga asiatica]|uniref:Defensin n=1 Tax=Striga asiatica TaxID=4170 RepID=A0A5A7PWZ3_STRAF|nr:defensin [Striga asiatica]
MAPRFMEIAEIELLIGGDNEKEAEIKGGSGTVNWAEITSYDSNCARGFEVEEKKICEYKSERFWGVCLSDIKCADVCKDESFESGDCQGLRRRCMCYNHC